MPEDKKEMCTIRIMFPVDSDEEAIAIKAKIKEVLGDKPDVQVQFAMMSGTLPRPMV